ncbi:MAG: hypothetical protein AAFX93_19665 [Verrucomicrobiota bacterium]
MKRIQALLFLTLAVSALMLTGCGVDNYLASESSYKNTTKTPVMVVGPGGGYVPATDQNGEIIYQTAQVDASWQNPKDSQYEEVSILVDPGNPRLFSNHAHSTGQNIDIKDVNNPTQIYNGGLLFTAKKASGTANVEALALQTDLAKSYYEQAFQLPADIAEIMAEGAITYFTAGTNQLTKPLTDSQMDFFSGTEEGKTIITQAREGGEL